MRKNSLRRWVVRVLVLVAFGLAGLVAAHEALADATWTAPTSSVDH